MKERISKLMRKLCETKGFQINVLTMFDKLIGPCKIWIKFFICNLQTDFSEWQLRHLLWNCPDMNVTELHWWSLNIGSGNGLVPPGNKPLPEPMLTQISDHDVAQV